MDGEDYTSYDIHEVYYNILGEPVSMSSDPIRFYDIEEVGKIVDEEAVENIIADMERALKTIKSEPVFVPPKEWSRDD